MEVPVGPVVAVTPLELLLYAGIAIAGFVLVVVVCALLLAIIHVALPFADGDQQATDDEPVRSPAGRASDDEPARSPASRASGDEPARSPAQEATPGPLRSGPPHGDEAEEQPRAGDPGPLDKEGDT